jgi:hypothetical protein
MNLVTIATAMWATFLLSMLTGLALTLLNVFVRRRGSAVGAQLLLTGPAGGLCAGAVFMLDTELPLLAKMLFFVLFGGSGVAIFVAVLRSRVTMRDVHLS